jgi:hypothetical protein
VFGFDIGLAKGLKQGGALHDPANLPALAPRAQFEKLKFGVSYSLPFQLSGKDFAFSTQVTAQHGIDTLYGSEQILIGGIYSVRDLGAARDAHDRAVVESLLPELGEGRIEDLAERLLATRRTRRLAIAGRRNGSPHGFIR